MQRERVSDFAIVRGFNTLSKMYHLFDTIKAESAKTCVEIGVFGGRTLIPMALACLETEGNVIGIDPWSAVEAAQPEIPFRTDDIDYDGLYHDLVVLLEREGLTNVSLVRATSFNAVSMFSDGSIDFLHIDGNHSRDKVYQDVTDYLPKVKFGGVIVMDDVGFATVAPALEYLCRRCVLMGECRIGGRDDMTFRKEDV